MRFRPSIYISLSGCCARKAIGRGSGNQRFIREIITKGDLGAEEIVHLQIDGTGWNHPRNTAKFIKQGGINSRGHIPYAFRTQYRDVEGGEGCIYTYPKLVHRAVPHQKILDQVSPHSY